MFSSTKAKFWTLDEFMNTASNGRPKKMPKGYKQKPLECISSLLVIVCACIVILIEASSYTLIPLIFSKVVYAVKSINFSDLKVVC